MEDSGSLKEAPLDQIHVVGATIDDAEDILRLQKLAFQQEALLHGRFDIPPLMQTLESIREDFQKYSFYKIVFNDGIVAAAKARQMDNNMLWIGRVVVHPEHQRKSLGTLIMNAIEAAYPDTAGYELFTAEKSINNIKFYEKLGYRLAGRFEDPSHDNIALVKMVKERTLRF